MIYLLTSEKGESESRSSGSITTIISIRRRVCEATSSSPPEKNTALKERLTPTFSLSYYTYTEPVVRTCCASSLLILNSA